MEVKEQKSISRIILRLIWQGFPFAVVMVVIALVIVPLFGRISAQKADLAAQQALQIKDARALTNVVTMAVQPELVMEKISLPGVAKPWISLNVVAEVKGKIVTKGVEEGARVKKGDILGVIDKRDYQHNYNSALASYDTAKTTEKRYKALSKKQFVTQSQLDDATARVKTTKAALDLAKLNLERCTIRSPMAGVVDRVFIEYGNFLDAGDPVVSILEMDRLKVEVGIPESDVAAVRKLSSFDMSFDALGGRSMTGNYHYLYKTTDSLARLYNLEIRLDNPDYQILPDMFARVTIVKNRDPEGLAVPIYSLVTKKNETGVFVEDSGLVAFRPVTTGFQDGWKILVAEGLAPGENVVVVGHRIIDDGEKVNVTRTVSHMEELLQ
ncbi:MAG: efflux RND transporter periplasmic adaptor subunit [Desulfobacterales bacterium]|nr:efflux RND transporter periplasmic adaptor subunit [Desulfobacterales bacterium]